MLSMIWIALNATVNAQNLAMDPEAAEKAAKKAEEKSEEKLQDNPEALVKFANNREELIMPGIKVMIKKGYIDVDAKVCLTRGMLELIACTKDSKEHEALIAVEPKAAHIHAALLLLDAKPGSPAMRKEVKTENGSRLVEFPPNGQEIDIFLVFDDMEGNPEEHSIKKFLKKSREDSDVASPDKNEKKDNEFPTDTFLFTGSHVYKDGEADPIYLADTSGNVISLSTFGDELLALPGVHANNNEGLEWGVDSTYLPELDSKVILRLKPRKPAAAEEPKK